MTYSPSISGRIGALIGGLVLTVILSVAIPKLLIEGVLDLRTQSVLIGAFALILVAGTVLTIVRVLVTGPVRVHTTPTHVTLHRAGRVRENWARSETAFSSFIIRESTNGIPTGVTRKLIAVTSGERVETVLRWFSKKTFNALIADVAPLVPATPTSFDPAPTVSSGTFTLDHSPVRRTRTVALVVLAVGLLAAAGFVLVGFSDDLGTIIVLVGGGLVLLVVIVAVLLVRGLRLPHQLSVSQSALTFDEKVFPLGQLVGIVATPAGYENPRGRAVTLVDTAGNRTRIGLGTLGNRTFPDYDRYLEAIRGATSHRPGMFTLDVA